MEDVNETRPRFSKLTEMEILTVHIYNALVSAWHGVASRGM